MTEAESQSVNSTSNKIAALLPENVHYTFITVHINTLWLILIIINNCVFFTFKIQRQVQDLTKLLNSGCQVTTEIGCDGDLNEDAFVSEDVPVSTNFELDKKICGVSNEC